MDSNSTLKARPAECEGCGKDFTSIFTHGAWTRFCTRKCSNAKLKQGTGATHQRRVRAKCVNCGGPLYGALARRKTDKCRGCWDAERSLKLSETTLGELRRAKNYPARNVYQRVRANAQYVAEQSGLPKICKCGYTLHVELHHKRGIGEFPDSATIGEVNYITNLEYLCPNGHWEVEDGREHRLPVAGNGLFLQ